MRKARVLIVLVAGLSLAAGQWANASGTHNASKPTASGPSHGILYPLAQEGMGASHKHHNSQVASLNDGDSASQTECKISNNSGAANFNLDCDGIFPNNEPHIVVDPADPDHMVA